MAVKKIWPFACGRDCRDLSAKRSGRARCLPSRDCRRAAERDTGDRFSKQKWLARKRAEEAAAITEWEGPACTAAQDASENAVASGHRARHAALTDTHSALIIDDGCGDEQGRAGIEDSARLISTRASWPIGNPEAARADMAELVEAAPGMAAVGNENRVWLISRLRRVGRS